MITTTTPGNKDRFQEEIEMGTSPTTTSEMRGAFLLPLYPSKIGWEGRETGATMIVEEVLAGGGGREEE